MGGAEFKVTAIVTPAGGGAPKTYTKEFRNTGADPELALDFDTGSQPIESLRIEIFDLDSVDGHIHIRTEAAVSAGRLAEHGRERPE